jgi:hypothetical protein
MSLRVPNNPLERTQPQRVFIDDVDVLRRRTRIVGQPSEGGSYTLDCIIREIRMSIQARESHTALYEETNFAARAEALDSLESEVLARIEGLLLRDSNSEALTGLKHQAETVRKRLEVVDEGLYRRLRQNIASGDCTSTELRRRLEAYAGAGSSGGTQGDEGYDSLDALVNGLLLGEGAPEAPNLRHPEMVFYQPTPARIVLELVDRSDFRQQDVFYDLGSGLGQVSILVHLLSGVRAKGVEVEPAYCDYARRCARGLNLSGVQFINADAREANYSDGTVFFMYSPFEGRMLERVLERLRHESEKRSIRLCTYGPCTQLVNRQSWLEPLDNNGNRADRLAMYRTLY